MAMLGAIGFSGKAIIVKLAYRHGVDAVTLLMWRMLLAMPFFLAMAWWAGRGQPALTRRDWFVVTGLGFCGYAFRLWRSYSEMLARRTFWFSIWHLSLLFAALLIDHYLN